MVYLILKVFCSTSIALILKYNDVQKGRKIVLLSANYFTAALVGLMLWQFSPDAQVSYESMLFGFFVGVPYVLGFFSFAKAVEAAGAPLATTASRLNVVIPVFLSILIYLESPSMFQAGGFFFTFITIVLLYFSIKGIRKREPERSGYIFVFLLFVVLGTTDFMMKVFQQWRPIEEKPFFLFCIFFSAFVYTTSIVLYKGIKPLKRTIVVGSVLGVPNVLSSFFLISALHELPGIVVYPVSNIGIIVLTAILAALIWKDKLDRTGILSLVSGIIAIILLSL